VFGSIVNGLRSGDRCRRWMQESNRNKRRDDTETDQEPSRFHQAQNENGKQYAAINFSKPLYNWILTSTYEGYLTVNGQEAFSSLETTGERVNKSKDEG
jgi:hypothetical protein